MKCFLTKLEIDFEGAYKAGLRDSYSWHQKIWNAFPNDGSAKRDFLTRLDETGNGFRLLLISKSGPIKPDWCPSAGWQSKLVPPTFFDKTFFRFSLVANPTIKVRSSASGELLKNSRRVPITERAKLLKWLERKAGQSGFSIPDLNCTRTIPRTSQTFVKNGKAGKLFATEYQGILQVTTPSAFQDAAINGLGSAKAFGFGMLCLSPL